MEEIEDERDDSDQDEGPVDGRIAEETQESVVERLAERRYRDAAQPDVREESIEGLGLAGDEPDGGRLVGSICRVVCRHVDRRSNVVSVLLGERTHQPGRKVLDMFDLARIAADDVWRRRPDNRSTPHVDRVRRARNVTPGGCGESDRGRVREYGHAMLLHLL